mgnify:CR=1 FL=1
MQNQILENKGLHKIGACLALWKDLMNVLSQRRTQTESHMLYANHHL